VGSVIRILVDLSERLISRRASKSGGAGFSSSPGTAASWFLVGQRVYVWRMMVSQVISAMGSRTARVVIPDTSNVMADVSVVALD